MLLDLCSSSAHISKSLHASPLSQHIRYLSPCYREVENQKIPSVIVWMRFAPDPAGFSRGKKLRTLLRIHILLFCSLSSCKCDIPNRIRPLLSRRRRKGRRPIERRERSALANFQNVGSARSYFSSVHCTSTFPNSQSKQSMDWVEVGYLL